ncbi:Inorganic pyrophosphatase, partial [Dissostichus eleginoides]
VRGAVVTTRSGRVRISEVGIKHSEVYHREPVHRETWNHPFSAMGESTPKGRNDPTEVRRMGANKPTQAGVTKESVTAA